MLKRFLETLAINLFIGFLVLCGVFVWFLNWKMPADLKEDQEAKDRMERVIYFGPPKIYKGKPLNVLKLEVHPHGFQNLISVWVEGGYCFTIYCGEPVKHDAWRKIAHELRWAESVQVVPDHPTTALNNALWNGELLVTRYGEQYKLSEWIANHDLLYCPKNKNAE